MSGKFLTALTIIFDVYLAYALEHYALEKNYQVDYQSADVLEERSVVSQRHCTQLCTASSCRAANYNPVTSQCQLLTSAVTRLIQQSGPVAMFRKGTLVEGQVGMWPLNDLYQGKNLVPGKTDIELYDVTFPDMSSEWMTPPVRFSGAASSYGQFIQVEDVKLSGSFAFIAAVYREQSNAFPLLEWHTGSHFAPHIWILTDRLFVNLMCGGGYHSTVVSNNQWYTVALSFDQDTNVVSWWTNGQFDQLSNACSSSPGFPSAAYAYVNNRPDDNRKITGRITCMGLYDRTMTYEDMVSTTTPHCKLQ